MNVLAPQEKSRKRDKIRSAWISFAGRIVAQLIGAIATVTLGVVVLGGHRAGGGRPTARRLSSLRRRFALTGRQ